MASPSKKGRGKQPTDPEENIKKLIKIVLESNDENLAQAAFVRLRQYVDNYIKLFSRKYKIPGHDEDEIEQECLFALRFKAIQDFDEKRGKFKTFATLCIRRHLYSIIKASEQQKRRVQNTALSLYDNWSDDEGNDLSLINLVVNNDLSVSEQIEHEELVELKKEKLLSKLSDLEKEVLKWRLLNYRYEEIVEKLKAKFPDKKINKKVIDNSLVRCRQKGRELRDNNPFFDQ